jgi:dihydrofolate reductase
MLILIVATDANGGIAKDGAIPWHCAADLKFFKTMTEGSPMILGRKTWDTLPNVVKARRCVVLSQDLLVPAWRNMKSVRETIRMALDATEDMYVIGGESIYRQFLPYCGIIYKTVIPYNFRCDQAFAENPREWKERSTDSLEGPVYSKDGAVVSCVTPCMKLLSRRSL